MSNKKPSDQSIRPSEIIDLDINNVCLSHRHDSKNIKALTSLIGMLPKADQKSLSPLLDKLSPGERSESDSIDHELFRQLREVLNKTATHGTLPRRDFMKVAGLLMTNGLASLIFPQASQAITPFAFWKKRPAAKIAVYHYTGSHQTFIVPAGVTSLQLKLWGAGGYARSGTSGAGGYSSGNLSVTPGETIAVMVGGASGAGSGYGGGAGSGGGGASGGRSAVFRGSVSFANEVITAGGGGGGDDEGGGSAGAGGGLTGQNSTNGASTGGTQSAGGSPGGARGQGEAGGGGAGGGGYYGGGAGNPGNGSGGSGYIGGVTSGVTTAGNYTSAPNTGNTDYIAGIGTGATGNYSSGGHGLVVIRW